MKIKREIINDDNYFFEAEYFIKEVKNIPTTYDDKTLEILFDLYDELTVEDCENKEVNECYETLNMLRGEEEQIPSSVRFVYVTKNFLKEIDELDNETKEYALTPIAKSQPAFEVFINSPVKSSRFAKATA